jgi:hypothetical protein
MSHVLPQSLATPDPESRPPTAASTPRTPAPVPTRRGWVDTTPMAELRRIVTVLTEPRPHYPHRESNYLEAARMSRAMGRL